MKESEMSLSIQEFCDEVPPSLGYLWVIESLAGGIRMLEAHTV